jgi:hypothetical protein
VGPVASFKKILEIQIICCFGFLRYNHQEELSKTQTNELGHMDNKRGKRHWGWEIQVEEMQLKMGCEC